MTKKKDKADKPDAMTKAEPASSALAQTEKHPFQRRDEPGPALLDVRPKSIAEGSRLANVFSKVCRHVGQSEEQVFETMMKDFITRHTDLEMEFSPEPIEGGFGRG